jgi:hypothetical protein
MYIMIHHLISIQGDELVLVVILGGLWAAPCFLLNPEPIPSILSRQLTGGFAPFISSLTAATFLVAAS